MNMEPTNVWTASVLAALTSLAGAAHESRTPDRDEIRAVVAEMNADVEGRSSLLAAQAGHDGGFHIASDSGDFRLNLSGLVQFRYQINSSDGNTAGDDFESGFNAPRTLLFFKGHIGDPRFKYQIRTNFSRTDGIARLDDAFIDYQIDDHWTLRFGQALHPFDREWYHGDLKLQTVERSLAALAFGGQRSQQITAMFRNDDLRFLASFSDGLRSQNTDFTADPAEWAFTARGEWKFAGEWKNVIGTVTSPRGSDYAGLLGGAIHIEQGPDVGVGDEQQLFAWTLDATVKGDGWNAFAAGTGYHTDDEAGVSGANFDEFGFVAQGGCYVADDTEIYGRYTTLIPDDDRAADDTFDAIALGLNHYIHGHAARFTIQAEWFLDATTDTVVGNYGNSGGRNPSSTLFGLLPSDEEDQFAITVQFQLMF